MKILVFLIALGSRWALLTCASPLTTTPLPYLSTNSSSSISSPRYSFEEIWWSGVTHIKQRNESLQVWGYLAKPPRPGEFSADVDEFTHVSIEALDARAHKIRKVTNIASTILWSPIYELPPPPPSSPFETFPFQPFLFTLEDVFRIVSARGFVGPWKAVFVRKWKPGPRRHHTEESYYWFEPERPTPERRAVVVGVFTGHLMIIARDGSSIDDVQGSNVTDFTLPTNLSRTA